MKQAGRMLLMVLAGADQRSAVLLMQLLPPMLPLVPLLPYSALPAQHFQHRQ
jgi:hypothetical protein